ncbi:hypothetical protein EC957_007531 [Mortierella hygrophila]|uniref:Alpha-taxilin n=1 Tax=Mortierella hygrophila TaxID=979708 RepID=A0A9P6JY10_9FUNG|nr:hypothetical protein EC957_007531 [Mortierella hygrophila]
MLKRPSATTSTLFPHLASHQCPKTTINYLTATRTEQPQENPASGYEQEQSFNGGDSKVTSEQDDAELEAAFQALRLSSLEEALASLNQVPHSDGASSSDSSCSSNPTSSSSSSSSPPTSPTFSNSDSSDTTSSIVPKDQKGSASTNGPTPKRTRRVLSQLDVNELIQMKISQLESAPLTEEDDEKAIAKQMKKVHKEISQVSNGQEDQIAKVSLMQRKYLELFQDMRKQERDHAKLKKKHELLQRERDLLAREKDRIQRTNDTMVAEHGQLLEERHADKVMISKSDNLCRKLEGLCRQIHRENKEIKWGWHSDRKTGSTMTQETPEVVDTQRPLVGNEALLREKLQGFMEQYDLREKHFNSVVKAKDLELQLAQAKLDRQNRASQEGAVKLDLLKSQLQESTKTEAELRKQLGVYVEKFKQVEETLNKSNTLFQTFRKEMEAMAKKGGRLEKVNVAIRAKCDTMNRNILEMVEERAKQQGAFDHANKKLLQLEALCRAFQAERAVLREELLAKQCTQHMTTGYVTSQNGSIKTAEDQADIGVSDASAPRTVVEATSPSFSTTGTTLSFSTAVFKQGMTGARRMSTPSSKFRQKPKRHRPQICIQRGDQHSALTLTIEGVVLVGEGGVIDEPYTNLENGFHCEGIVVPSTSMSKNGAEQIFAESSDMKKLNESVKKTGEVIGLASKETVIPTTSVSGRPGNKLDGAKSLDRTIKPNSTAGTNGVRRVLAGGGGEGGRIAKAESVKSNADAKRAGEQAACKYTHWNWNPKNVFPALSTGTGYSPSKKWSVLMETSTSLGAISRLAQAQGEYQAIRPTGLYLSAITIK